MDLNNLKVEIKFDGERFMDDLYHALLDEIDTFCECNLENYIEAKIEIESNEKYLLDNDYFRIDESYVVNYWYKLNKRLGLDMSNLYEMVERYMKKHQWAKEYGDNKVMFYSEGYLMNEQTIEELKAHDKYAKEVIYGR